MSLSENFTNRRATTMAKHDDALRLRDMAVRLVRSMGAFEEVSGIKVLTARVEDLEIMYVTPFQRMPGPKPPQSFEEAVVHAEFKGQPRHSVDVWAGRKVLSVGWDEGRPTEVVRFVRGPWEERLRLLVEKASITAPAA